MVKKNSVRRHETESTSLSSVNISKTNYHGLGFGGSSGVLTVPLPSFTTLLSMSKLLMDSLLGDRVFASDDGVGGCNRF